MIPKYFQEDDYEIQCIKDYYHYVCYGDDSNATNGSMPRGKTRAPEIGGGGGVASEQEKDKNDKEDETGGKGTDGTEPSPDTPDAPGAIVLKTLVAPEAVTAPSVTVDTPDKGKIRVTAKAPAVLGTTDGTPVDAKTIKYALYYARYGHSKDTITIDGGTSIADIAKAVGTTVNSDAGMVPITGNTALTTTGFAMPALSKDTIYRYFIRSIHPDDETKHTNTAARRAFVLNPASTKVKVISDTVTSIGVSAFYRSTFTSVFIPDTVTSIGAKAFMFNKKLTSVVIPDSVTSIGDGAFYNNKLTTVTIGNAVESIGDGAFDFNRLTSVIIPSSVTSIGGGAFANNFNLTTVTLTKALYDRINTAGNLDVTFGSQVTTYQDHAGTKLN